jgi:hypothetical protein
MIHPSSFRDPAGFIFTRDGVLHRQVNEQGRAGYDLLMSSGLYGALVETGDLIAHEEVDVAFAAAPGACTVIRPERVPFVSYPYEWSFGQLKDAALLTLRLQKAAMQRGLSLRDATSFNVMFVRGRPVWIDTLSFEALRPGAPWVAYRQFCELFLAPLALMSRTDPRAHQLLRSFLDGIPLPMASAMLPLRTWTRPGLLMHVHMHASAHRRLADPKDPRRDREDGADGRAARSNPNALAALVESLERTVTRLEWSPAGTTWGDYYQRTNYTDACLRQKTRPRERGDRATAALDRLGPRRQRRYVQPACIGSGNRHDCVRCRSCGRRTQLPRREATRRTVVAAAADGSSRTRRQLWAGPTRSECRCSTVVRPMSPSRWRSSITWPSPTTFRYHASRRSSARSLAPS